MYIPYTQLLTTVRTYILDWIYDNVYVHAVPAPTNNNGIDAHDGAAVARQSGHPLEGRKASFNRPLSQQVSFPLLVRKSFTPAIVAHRDVRRLHPSTGPSTTPACPAVQGYLPRSNGRGQSFSFMARLLAWLWLLVLYQLEQLAIFVHMLCSSAG